MTNEASGGGPGPAARRFRLFLLACAFLPVALAAHAAPCPQGKGEREEVPALDPYTKGEPEAMAKLGYESFGPFGWGDAHDTDEIVRVLGEIPLLWVETAHFKIGSSLAPYVLAQDRDEKDKLRAELTRLRKRLPKVKPAARELDRWLMLHLYAQRLEELYADFCRHVGVVDADFTPASASGGSNGGLGDGPYLGQREKFRVLLLDKTSGIGRYSGHFLGYEAKYSMRWYFHQTGAMFFGAASEHLAGTYGNDTAFHCTVAGGVVHNFVEGFRWYRTQAPLWLAQGCAHYFARRVDPRYIVYGGGTWSSGDPSREEWKWEPRVLARVKHEYYPTWEDMFAWSDYDELKMPDHMFAWSRVQFLLQDAGATQSFLVALKDAPAGADVPPPTVERQRELVEAAWGRSLAELDADWTAFVKNEYRSR